MKTNSTKVLPGDQILDKDFESWGATSITAASFLDEEDPPLLNPEELLWAAVLQQTIEDACLPETSLSLGADKSAKNAFSNIEVTRRQARAFIFATTAETSARFHDICEVLNLHPQVVRKKVAEYIRQGIPFKRTIGVEDEETQ